MTSDALNIAANVVAAIAFAAALVGVFAMPGGTDGFMRSGIKVLLGGAMAVYLLVTLSHILQFTAATSVLDMLENYLKTLFIPLLAVAAYGLRLSEQLRATRRHARALAAEHEMLLRIVDTTPSGVVVLDGSGRIEFANDRAKAVLELHEDPNTFRIAQPVWACSCTPDMPGDLVSCLPSPEVADHPCALVWPDGRSLALMISVNPILAPDGTQTGSVVAFTAEEPSATSGSGT